MFQDGVGAARDLANAVGTVMDALSRMGIGVDDVVTAFIAWKSIQGVSALSTQLGGINTLLSSTLPASAATGAAGITAALSRIAAPLWLAKLIEDKYPNFPIQDQPTGEDRIFPGWVPLLPTWEDWIRNWTSEDPVQTGAVAPPGPLPQLPQMGGGGGPGTVGGIPIPGLVGANSQGPYAPFGNLPGQIQIPVSVEDRRGTASSTPSEAGAPAGNPILPPPGAAGGDGAKLPKAPVVPYDTSLPPGIPGMPPDASVFAAESSFLDARHTLAEKQARLNQLINSNVATEQDILDARNDVAAEERDFQAAEMRTNEARQTQYKQMTKQLSGAASDLSDLGAALDKDFGISKGLGGLTRLAASFVAINAAITIAAYGGDQAEAIAEAERTLMEYIDQRPAPSDGTGIL